MTVPHPLPDEPRAARPQHVSYAVAGLALLALVLGGLFYYKWTGSARTIAGVLSSGTWSKPADPLVDAGPLASTRFYFSRIWIALAYGLLVGAAVRAFVSPAWIARLLSGGGAMRRQVVAAGTGMPLMLCSCCVTPVFSAVYGAGTRLGSALAVMLASPGLNPAALVLTFILFPWPLAGARLGGALVSVVLLPLLVERVAGTRTLAAGERALVGASAGSTLGPPATVAEFARRFARCLVDLTLLTVPLIILGVLVSSVVLQAHASLRPADTIVGIAIVAAAALLLSLPTFFEIPIALVLFHAGAPSLAAVALFAGPIVNLPSLFVLGREANVRAAVTTAAGVWAVAVAAGVVTSAIQ